MSSKTTDPHTALWQHATRGVKPLAGHIRAVDPESATGRATAKRDRRPPPPSRPAQPFEAKLDLHGLTLVEAHRTVERFLTSASAAGVRRVLIVTGKGSGRPGSTIRGEIGHWLETPRMRVLVQSSSPAPRQLGGDGALQVQLKKR